MRSCDDGIGESKEARNTHDEWLAIDMVTKEPTNRFALEGGAQNGRHSQLCIQADTGPNKRIR